MSYLQAWEVFIAVAEEKSFSAAAKKLSLSQPTISFHIDGLEKKLGCSLFERSRRGIELTPYGKSLFADTHCVKGILSRAEKKVRELYRGASGHVVIGAGTIPGEYILPAVLADFLSEHPDVTISLQTGDSQSIFQQWQEGKIPLCVIGFLPPGVTGAHRIWDDEIIPVISTGLATTTRLHSRADLYQYPLVLRHESSASMSTVHYSLECAGIAIDRCRIAMKVTGNEALKSAVKAGAGIGFVSKRAVERELGDGSLVQVTLPGISIKRNFYALFNPEMEIPAAALLREYLLHQGAKPNL